MNIIIHSHTHTRNKKNFFFDLEICKKAFFRWPGFSRFFDKKKLKKYWAGAVF